MIKSVPEYIAAMTGRITSLESVEEGIKTLLSTQSAQLVAIRAELANAGVPPEQLASLDSFLTTLDTDTAGLTAAAVAAGTVAEGEPQPDPVEQPVSQENPEGGSEAEGGEAESGEGAGEETTSGV